MRMLREEVSLIIMGVLKGASMGSDYTLLIWENHEAKLVPSRGA